MKTSLFLIASIFCLLGYTANANDCDYYSGKAFNLTAGQPAWVGRYAAAVCSLEQLSAFTDVISKRSYEWEFQWAVNVRSAYGLAAFREIMDDKYYEWELGWASYVNNYYAQQAFSEVTDDNFSEWELRWAVQIHTERELRVFRHVRSAGIYYESDLRWAALLDG